MALNPIFSVVPRFAHEGDVEDVGIGNMRGLLGLRINERGGFEWRVLDSEGPLSVAPSPSPLRRCASAPSSTMGTRTSRAS